MKVRNWSKFQHFKNKTSMVWFKVYGRDIINDPDWHELSSDQKATLFELWCLASEKNGELPDLKKLCFRLHKDKEFVQNMLITLNSWFESDTANSIYGEYTEYAREKKREDEKIGYEKREDKKITFIKDIE
jgi:hypothetical protein